MSETCRWVSARFKIWTFEDKDPCLTKHQGRFAKAFFDRGCEPLNLEESVPSLLAGYHLLRLSLIQLIFSHKIEQIKNHAGVATVPPLVVLETDHDAVVWLEVVGDVVGGLLGTLFQFFIAGGFGQLQQH